MNSVARVSEIISRSQTSFDDAVENGVKRASETLRNVKSAWVKDQELELDNGSITAYKVTLRVTFVLD